MSLTPAARLTVLVVDDTPENLVLLGELLRPHYQVRVANSGERALRAVQTPPYPDLILLDVMMPGMDGYAVMTQLHAQAQTQDIPVIFVTALDAQDDEEHGLRLGAVDYVTKPIRPAILLARISTHLALKQARDVLQDRNGALEREVTRRVAENELVKEASLHALALLAEARDNETGNHLHRTQRYVEALAHHLAAQPRDAAALTPNRIRMIGHAAPLHDIGKVGIPDHILLKPGKLTAEEYEQMKLHPCIGSDAIEHAMARATQEHAFANVTEARDSALAFLEIARQIARHHHERWDGTGYPDRLVGENIPLPARLMALADVFDALSCRRVYKPAFPAEEVDRIILEGRGSHFDPLIIDAYLALREEFRAIALRYADAPTA